MILDSIFAKRTYNHRDLVTHTCFIHYIQSVAKFKHYFATLLIKRKMLTPLFICYFCKRLLHCTRMV